MDHSRKQPAQQGHVQAQQGDEQAQLGGMQPQQGGVQAQQGDVRAQQGGVLPPLPLPPPLLHRLKDCWKPKGKRRRVDQRCMAAVGKQHCIVCKCVCATVCACVCVCVA